MGKLLDLDSPIMRFLSRMADLLWLNFLTLILCLPVVTAGAAITALHYTCLKMVRGEESYVTKDFFKSFKVNFKQSTIIWLIALAAIVLLVFDFRIILAPAYAETLQSVQTLVFVALCVVSVLFFFTLLYVFPIQSHFINPIKVTVKNAFLMSFLALPKTVLMALCWVALPIIILYVQFLSLLGLLFVISLPVYLNAMIYNKTFKRFEPAEQEENDDFSWTVSADEDGASAETSDIKSIEDESTEN